MPWIKTVGPTLYSKTGITYTNPSAEAIKYVILYDDGYSGHHRVQAYVNDKSLFNKINRDLYPQHSFEYLVAYIQPTKPEHAEHLDGFLSFCVNTGNLDLDVATDIFKELKILHPVTRIWKEILDLLKKNKINEAGKLALDAQNSKRYDIIMDLVLLLDSDLMNENKYNVDPQFLYDLYSNVSKENPHYTTACEKKLDLLYTQKPSDVSEAKAFLEEKFEVAINAGNQTQSDQLFHQLMGGKGLTPSLTGIKPDIETLLTLAREMNKLQIEVERLQQFERRELSARAALKRNNIMTTQSVRANTDKDSEESQLNMGNLSLNG